MTPLMTQSFIENALHVKATAAFSSINGVSIDTRTIEKGDLFVALVGEQRDGHEFVKTAFEKGAAAALVKNDKVSSLSISGPLIPVDDTLSALVHLGAAARARLTSDARVVAVTGSVGKTGTKEALRFILSQQGKTHASVASYNNHFGVPLTLARMDQATKFGIFEIGMNHGGEIEPLTRQVKPHVALITTVEAVHIENFPNVEAIADEKSAIFLGLEEGGTAIINRDNPHYERMWTHASRSRSGRLLSFGENPFADIRLVSLKMDADGSDIIAEINGLPLAYRLGSPGKHLALNSLGILAVCLALGADLEAASRALADVKPPQGRGARLSWGEGIIESRSSMKATMQTQRPCVRRLHFYRRRKLVQKGDASRLSAICSNWEKMPKRFMLISPHQFKTWTLILYMPQVLSCVIYSTLCRAPSKVLGLKIRKSLRRLSLIKFNRVMRSW